MIASTPRYLLFSESDSADDPGRWRFVLQRIGTPEHVEVADEEPGVRGERLDLLTVVRALESLDQPSEVTIMTSSRYVFQGVQYGIPEWSRNGWRWEFFGQMVPVKNADLWQRVERALRFHRVQCQRQPAGAVRAVLPSPMPVVCARDLQETERFRRRVAGWPRVRYVLARWECARAWLLAHGRPWWRHAMRWWRTRVLCCVAGHVILGSDRWRSEP